MAPESGGEGPRVRRRRRWAVPTLWGIAAIVLVALFAVPLYLDDVFTGDAASRLRVGQDSSATGATSPETSSPIATAPAATSSAVAGQAVPSSTEESPPAALTGSPSPPAATGPAVAVSIERLASEPGPLLGQVVTVSGEVVEVLGLRTFVLGGGQLPDGAQILVASMAALPGTLAEPAGSASSEATAVRVTGTLRRFELDAIEGEIAYGLDDAIYRSWEGQPAIVAASVSGAPGGEAGAPGLDPAASPSPAPPSVAPPPSPPPSPSPTAATPTSSPSASPEPIAAATPTR